MSNKSKFVHDQALPRARFVRSQLIAQGYPETTAEWLSEALLKSNCIPDDDDSSEVLRCLLLNDRLDGTSHRDECVLGLIESITAFLHCGLPLYQATRDSWTIPKEACDAVVAECVANGVDFTGAFVASAQRPIEDSQSSSLGRRARSLVQRAQMLWRLAVLAPERVCDLSRLESADAFGSERSESFNSVDIDRECTDVASPMFWMVVGVSPFMRCLTLRLGEFDDSRLSRLAHGVLVQVIRLGQMAPLGYQRATGDEILREVFHALDSRVGAHPRNADDGLRSVWMRTALEWTRNDLSKLEEHIAARIQAAADYELGTLRSALSRGTHGLSHFERMLPTLGASSDVLFERCRLWDAMRPLILLLRALPSLAVAPDMRYWTDQWHRPDAPRPWNRVPEILVNRFHGDVGKEQFPNDPELQDLRTRFAEFCLSRLKSNSRDQSFVEPDPQWREAYVHAAHELRVNPYGRGHHALHRAMTRDPSSDVQAAAKEAYADMRHGPTLPKGFSPRRTITNALMYLLQAHFMTVAPSSFKIDHDGVQRTREEIARRTTEPAPESNLRLERPHRAN